MKNEIYEAPLVQVIEVEVEKGFALSEQTESLTIGDPWEQ